LSIIQYGSLSLSPSAKSEYHDSQLFYRCMRRALVVARWRVSVVEVERERERERE
jgi:hypothetical protein